MHESSIGMCIPDLQVTKPKRTMRSCKFLAVNEKCFVK